MAYFFIVIKLVLTIDKREHHKFLEIRNDILISLSSNPRPTTAFSASTHYTFTSLETGEHLWSVVELRREVGSKIIEIQEKSLNLLQMSRNGASRSFESVSQLDLFTGEHIGAFKDCKIFPPNGLNLLNGISSFNRVLDAKSYVQNEQYMYIKTQDYYDTTEIYQQKRCDYPNYNPDTDKAVMYMSYNNDKQWIAGPVNSTFFFTDKAGLYLVSTNFIDNYEARISAIPALGKILDKPSSNSLYFSNAIGVNSQVTHLRIFENYLISGSDNGMFHVHDLGNNQLLLKADLDAEVILESFSLENGFVLVTNNKVSYFEFEK